MRIRIFLLFIINLSGNVLQAQPYVIPGAQQQPAYIFPIWFKDGNGQTDTFYFAYDPSADNLGIGHDTIFGEKFTKIDTSNFTLSSTCICPPFDTIGIHVEVNNGLPAATLTIWKAKLPLTIKWDKNLFYDSTLLSIPLPNQLPNPLFEIKVFCNDFNPNYNNCGSNYPIFWVPEDNIGCCPDPYDLSIKTDSMVFLGDTVGPFSTMNNTLSINFDMYTPWIGVDEVVTNSQFSVHPNPFFNSITLKNESIAPYKVEIFSSWGVLVFSSDINANITELTLSESLPLGFYVMKMTVNSKSYFIKIIKMKII